jgi:hypothetical protein
VSEGKYLIKVIDKVIETSTLFKVEVTKGKIICECYYKKQYKLPCSHMISIFNDIFKPDTSHIDTDSMDTNSSCNVQV